MAWVTEKLIGSIGAGNKIFTLSHAPVLESLIVYLNRPFERVGTQPDTMEFQYAVNSNEIELGTAPASEAERPIARYWWNNNV